MGGDSITWRIVRSEGETVEVKVKRGNDTVMLYPAPKVPEKAHWWNRRALRQIGIAPAATPVIAKTEPDSPAAKAGLLPDDRLLKINGEKIYTELGIYEYMKDHPDEDYTLTVQRGNEPKPSHSLPTVRR